MKTSKFVAGCLAAGLVTVSVAAESGVQIGANRPKLSPQERMAIREARIAAAGGFVARPIKGKVVRILLRTDKISLSDAQVEALNMSRIMRLRVEVVESESRSANKTGCLITLAELDKAPTLLVAPEEYWATVNVSKLTEGNPTTDVLKSRIIKEMWRALGYALGAANQTKFPCVMRPISRPSDLDMEKVAVLSPEPMAAVINTAMKLGFASGGQSTYRKACQEGWAPAPTNDLQKAIWDEVHTPPSDPIKIKYDPKRDK